MKSCLVGVSGGVDSLFAALKLKEKGWNVIACHLFLSERNPQHNLKETLQKHGIELFYADYREAFREMVVEYFIKEYSKGYTPNPCVICNRDVKLPMLAQEADRLGIKWIATGHYADKAETGLIKKHKTNKDQSYFLACVEREIIERTIFPLAEHSREEIEKALGSRLPKSSDLCFVNRNYRKIITQKLGIMKGEIVKGNEVVGYHNGFYNYTIGQRKGIKVGNTPHYVVSIDAKRNRVFVGNNDELFKEEFILDDLKIHIPSKQLHTHHLECMVRFSAKPKPCRIDTEKRKVILLEKERAITPGQIAVFYSDGCVVACGKIGHGNH